MSSFEVIGSARRRHALVGLVRAMFLCVGKNKLDVGWSKGGGL